MGSGKQRLRVRMRGTSIEAFGAPFFDHFAQVHDDDLVRHIADDGKIVRDEYIGSLAVALQIEEQLADRRLHGHVERGERLIAENEFRRGEESPGDRDPLLLPAGKLAGQAVLITGRQPHLLQGLLHMALGLARSDRTQRHQVPMQSRSHGQRGVERRLGILKHHLHRLQNTLVARQQARRYFDAKIGRRSLVGFFQARDAPQERALARTAFANQAHDRTARDAQ